MRTHAQAVVIGGGVVGCSILYHLAKLGWTEVVLLERERADIGLHLARGGEYPRAA
jgi:dimethylglycine dehydrogenase